MSWTDDPDNLQRCCATPGAVEGNEQVYRLLHDRNDATPGERFRRAELQHDPKKPISNECGKSHGMSVMRRAGISDAGILQESDAFAKSKGFTSRGAICATAAELRSVKLDEFPGEQLVFVYDDGKVNPEAPDEDNPLHVVIRVKRSDRPSFDRVRDKLEDIFAPNRINPVSQNGLIAEPNPPAGDL